MMRKAEYRKLPDGSLAHFEQGEFSYFAQENPNVDIGSRQKIDSERFVKTIECIFFECKVNRLGEGGDNIYSVSSIATGEVLFSKNGYVCVAEATAEDDPGVLYSIEDGAVFAYNERI
jgi:hypothetical protein